MDLIEVMQDKGEQVLSKALVNTTHWNIVSDTYHRMGAAIVDGYLNLHLMRQVKSRDYIYRYRDSMTVILANAPHGANAYSIGSGEYLNVDALGMQYMKYKDDQLISITSANDLSKLVFFNHINDVEF